MTNNLQGKLSELWQQILGYLPSLLGGLLILLLGWLIAWIIKRMVVQLLVILRFDRLFVRLRWKRSLSKADLRYALYNSIGNIAFFIVYLIFLNAALSVLKVEVLSKLIEQGVLFVPRLVLALIITGIGWLIATRAAAGVHRSLIKENVRRGSLLAKMIKFILILFFSAMALVELNIAKEIVIIGFGAVAVTVCVSTLLVLSASRESLKDILNEDRSEKP